MVKCVGNFIPPWTAETMDLRVFSFFAELNIAESTSRVPKPSR